MGSSCWIENGLVEWNVGNVQKCLNPDLELQKFGTHIPFHVQIFHIDIQLDLQIFGIQNNLDVQIILTTYQFHPQKKNLDL